MKNPETASDGNEGRSADAGSPAPKKNWKVGTLTYTSGGVIILFLWLLFGDFAWSMRDRSVGPMAQWYLKSLGVSNLLFGLLISSFPALVSLVLGPIISMKSDRYRSKWGRRIPFLLVTAPIGAMGMIGLAVTPFVAKWVHGHFPEQDEMVVAVICFGVFWALFDFATTISQSVFGGLINDVVPQPLLGRFYGLFRAVSLIDGIIFNYWIMGYVPTHFTIILASVGTFYGVAFTWVCFRVKEGDYPPPANEYADDDGSQVQGRRPSLLSRFFVAARTYFRECFTNSYYISIFVMLTLGALCFIPVNAFAIPYANSVNMSMAMYGKCLALTFCISLFLSYFLGWLADIFHPIRMSMAALCFYLLVTLWGWRFADTADTFAIAFVLHALASGTYATSVASLGQRLYPHSKFAQFASAGGIFMSLSVMAISPITGIIIDWSDSDYSYTFLIGGGMALVALISAFYAYGRFVKLGGPKNYVAPQ